MIGLALSGGGVRVSYQVGVYYALKKNHIKIDGFVGTSIGAFNAAMLASGKDKELLELWQTIDPGIILGFTENLSKLINENKKDFNLLKEIVINVKNVIVNKGISTDGLKKILERYEIDKSIYKSKKDFGLVTVRFKDFKSIYMFKNDIPPDKFNEYLMASCYLPVFKMEKIIDDNYYLDGGFKDNLPVNSLIDKGYNKVYVVDLHAIGIKQKCKDENKVIVINPSQNLGSILNVKQNEIKDNIKLGYYDTLKVIKNLDGEKYLFKVKSNLYYKIIFNLLDKDMQKEMIKFFNTEAIKTLIIKSVEFIMKKEKYSYFKVYNINKVIKKIKKENKKYGVYKFINNMKLFRR